MNQAQTALIIVDMQNDFMPNGALAVQNADQIIQPINQVAQHFQNVILTQDWHPDTHISFADNHVNQQAFDYIELSYGQQVLWPRHCVQGSQGAEFHQDLCVPHAQLIIRKGYHTKIDSYSAFLEADKKTATGLVSYLRERYINTVYIVGVATDYCVKWTALDAQQAGFTTYVIEDMCKAIDINGSLAQAWLEMSQAGVQRVRSEQIAF